MPSNQYPIGSGPSACKVTRMSRTAKLMVVACALAVSVAEAQLEGAGQAGADAGRQAPAGRQLNIAPGTVRDVQQALAQRGYFSGQADGNWNEQSEQALREFQRAQGLEPTGQFDQQTLSALGLR